LIFVTTRLQRFHIRVIHLFTDYLQQPCSFCLFQIHHLNGGDIGYGINLVKNGVGELERKLPAIVPVKPCSRYIPSDYGLP
jgi:hypothetical protein